MTIKRGWVFLATLDPTLGREIAKTRPVVIVSNDKNNAFSGTVSILPVTSKNVEKTYPVEVLVPKGAGNLPKTSKVKADQIRTLDKRRLVKFIGVLADEEMDLIAEAVKIHLDLT